MDYSTLTYSIARVHVASAVSIIFLLDLENN